MLNVSFRSTERQPPKTTNYIRVGSELQTMAIFLNANDWNSKFERDYRLSGRRVRGTAERQA
ncbi:hypothetical protein WO48_25620 [Salmonella enterica subsp. enterica]|nr:hypothetical protein [Salmonella enterica subsp. enterica]